MVCGNKCPFDRWGRMQSCYLSAGHAGDHIGEYGGRWAQAPDAAQAPNPTYLEGKAHMTAIPFGGRWPEVPVSPIEPGLKAFDVRYTVRIEATDQKAAEKLSGAIAEFMLGAASAHDDQGVAAVQSCGFSIEATP